MYVCMDVCMEEACTHVRMSYVRMYGDVRGTLGMYHAMPSHTVRYRPDPDCTALYVLDCGWCGVLRCVGS